MTTREIFEKWHPVPECAYWCEQVALYGLKVPADVGTDTWIACYGYNDRWRGFQSGMAAGMERAAGKAKDTGWHTAADEIRAAKEQA